MLHAIKLSFINKLIDLNRYVFSFLILGFAFNLLMSTNVNAAYVNILQKEVSAGEIVTIYLKPDQGAFLPRNFIRISSIPEDTPPYPGLAGQVLFKEQLRHSSPGEALQLKLDTLGWEPGTYYATYPYNGQSLTDSFVVNPASPPPYGA